MLCPSCGSIVNKHATSCPICGEDLSDSVVESSGGKDDGRAETFTSATDNRQDTAVRPDPEPRDAPAREPSARRDRSGYRTMREHMPKRQKKKSHRVRNGLIVMACVVVVMAGVLLGLSYFDVLKIPLLPSRSHIALSQALDGVQRTGNVAFSAQADVDGSAGLSREGQGFTFGVDAHLDVHGTARDFSFDDPLAMKADDGMFAREGITSLEAMGIDTSEQPFDVRGTYKLDLEQGRLDYATSQPVVESVAVEIDANLLRDSSGGFLLGPDDIEDIRMDGDAIVLSLNGADIEQRLHEWDGEGRAAIDSYLAASGIDPDDVRIDIGSIAITMRSDKATGAVDVHASATLSASTSGEVNTLSVLAEGVVLDVRVGVELDAVLEPVG